MTWSVVPARCEKIPPVPDVTVAQNTLCPIDSQNSPCPVRNAGNDSPEPNNTQIAASDDVNVCEQPESARHQAGGPDPVPEEDSNATADNREVVNYLRHVPSSF